MTAIIARRIRLTGVLVGALLWALGMISPAVAQLAPARHALVVAMEDYEASSDLDTTRQDGIDMAAALQAAGFRIHGGRALVDLDRAGLLRELRAFRAALRPEDIAVFYFAGHGVGHTLESGGGRDEVGTNWLLPADDGAIRHIEDLPDWAISVERVADMIQEGPVRRGPVVLILDMCRNRPFTSRDPMRSTPTRGAVRQTERPGVMYAFAAGPGQVASSRHPRRPANGLYTGALLDLWATNAHLPVDQFLRLVGDRVSELEPGQRPMRFDDLRTDQLFSLTSSLVSAIRPQPVPTPQPQPQPQPTPAPVVATFLDARTTSASTRAPVIRVDPASLPDFALFRECEGCPEMVVMPGGSFQMGSPDGEAGRGSNEGPQRRVSVGRFAMSRFETTWAEWEACVAAGRCTSGRSDEGWGKGRRPVINVTWNDARAYAGYVSGQTPGAYRLPSEAEWEYATRDGTSGAYPWGPNASREHANYGANQCCSGIASGRDQWVNTAPVGQFSSGPFGLFDMHGNVSEWVEDCHDFAGAPSDGAARTTCDHVNRVTRGSTWRMPPPNGYSVYRVGYHPITAGSNLGFRLARTL